MTTDFFNKKDSFEEQCKKFSELLELSRPVSEDVLFSAIHDEEYARQLIINKRIPSKFMKLLRNPPKVKSNHKSTHPHSNAELIKSAAVALIKWGKSGFTKVDAKTLETRENACLACPNMVDPGMVIQKIIPSHKISNKVGERTGKHICDLCGCQIHKKIQLISENCPDKHPELEGMTRWHEPI